MARGQMTVAPAQPKGLVAGDIHVLFEEARRRRRRRQVWTGIVLTASLAVGAGFVFGSTTTPIPHNAVVNAWRSGGPVLPGHTGLYVDAFVLHGAYVMDLDTGKVRSAVAIPNYLGGYNNVIPRSGHVYLDLPFGVSVVLPNDLQSVRSLSIRGYPAPGLRPGDLVFFTGKREAEVDVRGQVLRSVPLSSGSESPVAEGSSGLVVMGGPPGRRLDLVEPTTGQVLRTLGYAWDAGNAFAGMAGGDRLVWIGSRTPWYPNFLNPPVAVHVTDLRTGSDIVIGNPPGLLPYSLAVSPKADKVAVLWERPDAKSPDLRSDDSSLGIADLTTTQIQPVPDAAGATDLLAWSPHGGWLFFGTSHQPIALGYANGFSAYKVGTDKAQPFPLPKYAISPAWITVW
jgi:hypothetical protein